MQLSVIADCYVLCPVCKGKTNGWQCCSSSHTPSSICHDAVCLMVMGTVCLSTGAVLKIACLLSDHDIVSSLVVSARDDQDQHACDHHTTKCNHSPAAVCLPRQAALKLGVQLEQQYLTSSSPMALAAVNVACRHVTQHLCCFEILG